MTQEFIFLITGSILTLFAQAVLAFISNHNQETREQREYLRTVAKTLAEIRGEVQWAQSCLGLTPDAEEKYLDPERKKAAFERLEIALGRATGMMLTVDDKKIRDLGLRIMHTDNPVDQNDFIEQAIMLLAPRLARLSNPDLAERFG